MSDFFRNTEFAGCGYAGAVIRLAKDYTGEQAMRKLINGEISNHWFDRVEPTEVMTLVDKMREICKNVKFFKPEEIKAYKIWGWGYDQTNYENLELIGEFGSYYLGRVHDWNFYKIPKKMVGSGPKRKDGTTKDYYKIDDCRTTSWEPPRSAKDIARQEEHNTYYGH